MKNLFFIAMLAFVMNVKAQIVLEHTYDSAATYNFCQGKTSELMIIKFEISGERYVKINRCGKVISIYDMNHSLIKNISLANCPGTNMDNVTTSILYLSETLFNTDKKMEFMYLSSFTDPQGFGNFITSIYNEDGLLLFSDTSAPLVWPHWHMQQYPIYNTSLGTKMLLSCVNGQARVFSLPGTLTNDIAKSNDILGHQSNISNPYPNPSINSARIDYILPDGIDYGVIVFYNLQGNEVKRFSVDRTFNSLLVTTSDIMAGTYYYQLQAGSNYSEGKKMVIIK